MTDSMIPSNQFGPEFFSIIGGLVFAFLGLIVRYAYRSKCRHTKFCCIEVDRDVDIETEHIETPLE